LAKSVVFTFVSMSVCCINISDYFLKIIVIPMWSHVNVFAPRQIWRREVLR